MVSTLRNWSIAVGGPDALPRQLEGLRVLFGNVYGRLGVRDGEPIRSNAILRIEGDRVYTASGSVYVLEGPACEDFQAWHDAQTAGFRRNTAGFWANRQPPAITEVD